MKEITKMKTEKLVEELAKKRESLRKIQFDLAGASVKDTTESKKLRRDIARILTELNKR